MNLKGLGKKQIRVLSDMASKRFKIVAVLDCYDNSETINLKSEFGEDIYESFTGKFIESLFKRKLLNSSSFLPSIRIQVITFTIKESVRKHFLNEVKNPSAAKGNKC